MRLLPIIGATMLSIACGTGAFGAKRPNVIVIMSDDMGFSDIGCYGSEIKTPNLDSLAAGGVRFTQFYNNARCCPSRASLITGLYPHEAGIGHMMQNGDRYPGYGNGLSTHTVTFGEVMRRAGYRTYMAGKWHVTILTNPHGPKYNWPLQRGFDKFYGTITGAGNYFDPTTLCRGNRYITPVNDPEYHPAKFYYTDAITDNAIKFVREHEKETPDKPFFMYVAYTAAHWPMQAPAEEIARQKGNYDAGYDAVRQARFKRVKELGLVPEDLEPAPTVGDWSAVKNKAWEARCMEVYAAMVHRMDEGVGRLIGTLKQDGLFSNTLVFFLEDNGGCAEPMGRESGAPYARNLEPMGPNDLQPKVWPPMQTRDGRPVKTGHDVMPGSADSYIGYGENWANVSDTPFRKYKHYVEEGGISTPLIASWPDRIPAALDGKLVRDPAHLIDIMATLVDVARTSYPEVYDGRSIRPMEGISLVPEITGGHLDRGKPIFWEHESNRAVRDGKWKIVSPADKPWALYDMEKDRAEMHDVSADHPDIVSRMSKQWDAWAARTNVLPLGAWKLTRESFEPKTTKTVFRMHQDDKIERENGPSIARRRIRVDVRVREWSDNGVLVSQGGSRNGYVLFMKDGKLHFSVRANGILSDVVSLARIPAQAGVVSALLRRNGKVELSVDGKKIVEGRASGAIPSTPIDGITVGADPAGHVGKYKGDGLFPGKIREATLTVEPKKPRRHRGKK